MDLKRHGSGMWTGFIWFWIGSSGGFLWTL